MARFTLFCPCGAALDFSEAMRGSIVGCECGEHYVVPERAGMLDYASAHLRWFWRWWRAGAVGRRSRRDGPYRERAAGVSCPSCGDVPAPTTVWQCELCWCAWNTFETKARCPGCGFRFLATGCLTCGTISRHSEWYA